VTRRQDEVPTESTRKPAIVFPPSIWSSSLQRPIYAKTVPNQGSWRGIFTSFAGFKRASFLSEAAKARLPSQAPKRPRGGRSSQIWEKRAPSGSRLRGRSQPASKNSFQGLQLAGTVEVLGLRHSGPRPVVAFGTLIIATGPAWCSPLNGVKPVNPHGAASAGLLNQKPT
jgi:hypothetical protein